MVFRMVFKDLTRFFVLAVLIDVPFVVALFYLEQDKDPQNLDFGTFLRSAASFFKISIAQSPDLTTLSGSSWALYASGSVLLGVLLLNLLIAMFSKTFDIIVENATQEYLLQKAQLTFLWARAPRMPPPLNIPVALRDLIMRVLARSVFTSDKFSDFCTGNYSQKDVIGLGFSTSALNFDFNKKAFQRIFPFNKGTQKFKAWVDKIMDDLEQNGEFNSEAQMDKFKSRMLRGINKLHKNSETLEALQNTVVMMQRRIEDEGVRLDHKLEAVLAVKTIKANEQSQAALDSGLSPREGGASALGEMMALQKQMHDSAQKLDQQVEVLRLAEEQKQRNGNQLEPVQEKMFLVLGMQKQLQEACYKQEQSLESLRQATEQRLEAMQKQTEQQMQDLRTLLQQVLGKLDA